MDEWNDGFLDNKLVLEKLGAALFEGQSLEAVLVNLFSGSVNYFETNWQEELQRLFAERNSNQILKKLETLLLQLDLPVNLMPELHQALVDRSWLLHNFYFELGRSVFDESGSEDVVVLLDKKNKSITQLVMDLNEILIDRQLEGSNNMLNQRMGRSIDTYLGRKEMF
jgi:hypothetical protein